MVANKDTNIVMKFNQQTAKNFPVYVVTCLDNEFSPTDVIEIMPFHERTDADAISYVADLASKNGWEKWEVFNDTQQRLIYKRNKHIDEEWSILDMGKDN